MIHPYTAWEDYAAGMFRKTGTVDDTTAAADLLRDPERFYDAATEMVREWSCAAESNLGIGANGRAWIGQATCCYATGAPEEQTRLAWRALTRAEQANANAVADRIHTEWEARTSHAETLFS